MKQEDTLVVRFEVLTAVVMTGSVCWGIMQFSPLKINQHFLGMCRSFACYLLHAGFLLACSSTLKIITAPLPCINFSLIRNINSDN
jgi:hypothetical protein